MLHNQRCENDDSLRNKKQPSVLNYSGTILSRDLKIDQKLSFHILVYSFIFG